MKNFSITGVHWKIQFLGGGEGGTKNNYIRGKVLKKGGLDSSDSRGQGLGKKDGGGVFEGGG